MKKILEHILDLIFWLYLFFSTIIFWEISTDGSNTGKFGPKVF